MATSSYTFDAHDADAILRAPLQLGLDQFKDFHIHKTILSVASAFFHDMFTLPQPPQPATGGATLPVVPVTESAEDFEVFLQLIYPVEPPTITSLTLVDNLFRLAEKYMANGVHAKLKQILVSSSPSSSFLRDDPILVYALACRANLDAEAEMAIPFTFNINLVQDIPRTHLQMMTAETYNRLLTAHAAHRAKLLSAVNQVKPPPYPSECSCGLRLYSSLRRDIHLAVWERPFLDKQKLDSYLHNSESPCGLGSDCRASEQAISKYLTNVLSKVKKLG